MTKNKIGIACKKKWEDLEYRQKVMVSHKKYWDDPEYIQKIRDICKDRPWIHKDNKEKRPKPDQLQAFLDNGWLLGRK